MKMELQKLLHMTEGVGENSYVNNSLLQRSVMAEAKKIVEESIKEAYTALKPNCFMMADMGCSTSPNALSVVTDAINVVHDICRSSGRQPPQFGVFLNDLPGNDYNTLFNFLQDFYKWVKQEKGTEFGPCFVSGTPKSFHGRVFPDQFLHFVHSGYAIHWLSQVPEGLVSEDGVALNKGNVSIGETSPTAIQKAYYTQFNTDFTLFLRSRAREVVPGGCMVLTFLGSIRSNVPHSLHQLLSSTINHMVLEGIIEERKWEEFNVPLYPASAEEVEHLIEKEGSFVVKRLETFTVDWSVHEKLNLNDRAKFLAGTVRAVFESLLANAFGEAVIDDIFLRLKTRVQEHIAAGKPVIYANILVSMTRRV